MKILSHLGESGDVTGKDFIRALTQVSNLLCENDNLIFYFSGHGDKINDQHFLVLSDDIIST
ncbi:caspase family protein [Paenibacillus sp. oral taxon 786]|uniref:caspase family protein n=1 Tax=Paenibacillus sp. oral taxon 786 TaxID=652715 RepID=UPI0012FA1962|nr:caspase family protein [Paenibacillus sp. oral taxon 786]